MLEEAYADPEKHRNLVIRVGGYSEYFHRLSDDLKKLVMSRMIH
jgi:formate C-acetyltransferase